MIAQGSLSLQDKLHWWSYWFYTDGAVIVKTKDKVLHFLWLHLMKVMQGDVVCALRTTMMIYKRMENNLDD